MENNNLSVFRVCDIGIVIKKKKRIVLTQDEVDQLNTLETQREIYINVGTVCTGWHHKGMKK